jgi:hypothetical protein
MFAPVQCAEFGNGAAPFNRMASAAAARSPGQVAITASVIGAWESWRSAASSTRATKSDPKFRQTAA